MYLAIGAGSIPVLFLINERWHNLRRNKQLPWPNSILPTTHMVGICEVATVGPRAHIDTHLVTYL